MKRIVFEKLPQRHVMFTIDVILYIFNILCRRSVSDFYQYFDINPEYLKHASHSWHHQNRHGKLGWVTSCHYIGTMASIFPVGVYVDKKGSQFCYIAGSMLSGISTLVLPFIRTLGSWEGVLLARFIYGFSQGFYLGGLTASLSDWILPKNRNFFIAFLWGVADLTRIVNKLMVYGIKKDVVDVNIVFIVYGALTFFLSAFVIFMRYNDAMVHPYMSIKERIKFVKYYDRAEKYRTGVVPLLDIIINVHVLGFTIGCVGGFLCSSVTVHFAISYLQLYSQDEVNEITMLSAIMVCKFVFGCTAAIVKDLLSGRKRKPAILFTSLYAILGVTAPLMLFLFAKDVTKPTIWTYTVLGIGTAFSALQYSSLNVNVYELTSTCTATVSGFGGTFLAATNISYAVFLSQFQNEMEDLVNQMYFCIFISVSCTFFFLLLVSVKDQGFAHVVKSKQPIQQGAKPNAVK